MSSYIREIVSTGNGSTFKSPNPIYFAIHSTANPGATAANHVNYWKNNPRKAVHLVSDWKEAYQCVEFKYVCNQVGNGNRTCIGIEICEARTKPDFEKGLAIARNVILEVLNQYGWDIDSHVRSHKWFTENYGGSDHIDPIPYFRSWGWSWDDFIRYLKEGDDMPSVQEIADAVWNKEIQNPSNNKMQQAGDYLRWAAVNTTAIKTQVFRKDDPSGRGVEMTDHEHLKWIAAHVVDQGKKIDAIMQALHISDEKPEEETEETE